MKSGLMKNVTTVRRNLQNPNFGATMKRYWFDSEEVKSALDEATRKNYNALGAYCMRVARNSMKRMAGPAAPGEPPHAHVGTLKKLLFYDYDPMERTLVVGPQLVGNGQVYPETVPRMLEEGWALGRRQMLAGIGSAGPIAVRETPRGKRANARKVGRRMKTSKGVRYVQYAKLKTAEQVRRSQDLSREYGIYRTPKKGEAVRILPHPYMSRAWAITKQRIPDVWYMSVKSFRKGLSAKS